MSRCLYIIYLVLCVLWNKMWISGTNVPLWCTRVSWTCFWSRVYRTKCMSLSTGIPDCCFRIEGARKGALNNMSFFSWLYILLGHIDMSLIAVKYNFYKVTISLAPLPHFWFPAFFQSLISISTVVAFAISSEMGNEEVFGFLKIQQTQCAIVDRLGLALNPCLTMAAHRRRGRGINKNIP